MLGQAGALSSACHCPNWEFGVSSEARICSLSTAVPGAACQPAVGLMGLTPPAVTHAAEPRKHFPSEQS